MTSIDEVNNKHEFDIKLSINSFIITFSCLCNPNEF